MFYFSYNVSLETFETKGFFINFDMYATLRNFPRNIMFSFYFITSKTIKIFHDVVKCCVISLFCDHI